MRDWPSVEHREKRVKTAIKIWCVLDTADRVRDVWLLLRNAFFSGFENSAELPWPPTDTFLEGMDGHLSYLVRTSESPCE